ncbi:hypothetical protein BLOT_009343 [Blomia tropicalis]|nr:hypothetical protein BLOT_009343 [Blomia tropicalis]
MKITNKASQKFELVQIEVYPIWWKQDSDFQDFTSHCGKLSIVVPPTVPRYTDTTQLQRIADNGQNHIGECKSPVQCCYCVQYNKIATKNSWKLIDANHCPDDKTVYQSNETRE